MKSRREKTGAKPGKPASFPRFFTQSTGFSTAEKYAENIRQKQRCLHNTVTSCPIWETAQNFSGFFKKIPGIFKKIA
jgi:hypothetical protein